MKPQPRYQRGDRIGGRYLVHKALMGGMGEVYLCLDSEEMIPLALKTFQQRYLTDVQRLRRAFETEVATWVALEKHPNIVRCFWMQTIDNQPFMGLEWVADEEGRDIDLRSWLRRGPLELKLALEIAIDICRGLIHAQQKQPGLVHRDLKPENILMAQRGLAKITDFGLAQIVATTGLEVAQESAAANNRQSFVGGKGIAGTPAYMAPEQWHGGRLDERTDIYALGCILHELLTGRSPFMVNHIPTTLQQWQTAHESAPYPNLPPPFTSALQQLLAGCLAKTPSDRPTSLRDLLARLAELYQQQFNQPLPVRADPGVFAVSDYFNRGVTYYALGQYAAALADYTHALGLDPNDATAYNNRGITYKTLQQHTAALADYTHAVTLDPKNAKTYYNRGIIYHVLQQYTAALADFTHAISLDLNFAQAYNNRGNTYHALEQHTAALADYTHAIRLDPNDAKTYANRGDTYHALQQHAAALADFTRALELDPNFAQAYANRGLIYSALQQHAAALADYTHAITLDPNNAKTYYNRGNIYGALLNDDLSLF